jgi:tRNA(fMet)-specific endonuclease VapC
VGVRLLLDTSAYAAMRRGNAQLRRLFVRADEVLLSMVTVGELLYGFHHGGRRTENLEAFERFVAQPAVHLLPVTFTTADRYARIAAALRGKGRPIPTNDIWIAAHALETGADLVATDEHFDAVDGLVWVPLRP